MTPETQRAVERVAELFDGAPWLEGDETGIPGAFRVTYADLSRLVTALSEASAREAVLREAATEVLTRGARPGPQWMALRTALSRTTPIEEA